MKKICTKCKDKKDYGCFNNMASKKDGKDCWCKQCRKKYRELNRQKIKERDAAWYLQNKDLIQKKRIENPGHYKSIEKKRHEKRKKTDSYKAYRKKYINDNRNKLILYFKKYRNVNRAILYEKQKAYMKTKKGKEIYFKNQERMKNRRKLERHKDRERHKRWKERNPEKYKCMYLVGNARRAKLLQNATGSFSSKQIRQLIILQNNDCYWCDEKLPIEDVSIDHFIPLCKGGTNSITNIVLCHCKCNFKKGKKLPDLFAKEIGKERKSVLPDYYSVFVKEKQHETRSANNIPY